jgi:hypothetical protein
VAPPTDPTAPALEDVAPDFAQALEVCLTENSDPTAVKSSLTILRKLIVNATTKGQDNDNPAAAAKFRKVRLGNAKIKAAVVDIQGALDIMMSVGFTLQDDDETGESLLVFPPDFAGEDWLPQALALLERHGR